MSYYVCMTGFNHLLFTNSFIVYWAPCCPSWAPCYPSSVENHLAVSGLTVRLPVWTWQQVCVKPVRKWGVRATWIFITTAPVYWLQCGGHTQVRLFGPPESTVNWPGRRREEGGSELIAHTGYPGSVCSRQLDRWRWLRMSHMLIWSIVKSKSTPLGPSWLIKPM